jgi:hypothetical protein
MFDSNNQNSQNNEPQSFLGQSANDGAVLGILLAAFSIFMMLSANNGFFALISLAIFIAVPFLTYNFLKRAYKLSNYNATFSMLWLHGINTFICGGLIMALAIFVYLRFIHPNFIVEQLTQMIEMFRSFNDREYDAFAASFEALIDSKQLPTPISVAFSNMFSVVFTGSLLSAVVSLIVRAINHKDNPTPPPYNGN